MADKPEEKPKVVKDTLEEALGSVDRTFDGGEGGEEEPTGEETVMSGHPAAESEQPGKETEEEAGSEEEGDKKETPKEKPATELKYKSHEEAETAAAEGQRQITKLAMELQETKDLLLKTLATHKTKPEEEPPATETAVQFAKRRRREALDQIEGLDPDDENHKDKVAEIQAAADEDILTYHREESVKVDARKKEESDGAQTTINQAQEAMKEAGLDPKPDSPDGILFWSLSLQIPKEKDGVPISMKDQIAQCISAVKDYKNKALDDYKAQEAQRLAERKQEEEEPLGRGASGPEGKGKEKSEATKPVTLGGTLEEVLESRRI